MHVLAAQVAVELGQQPLVLYVSVALLAWVLKQALLGLMVPQSK
jgi:hypothetical protein